MEEVTESAEKGKKMNLFSNYFLLNLLLGAVEKEHHFTMTNVVKIHNVQKRTRTKSVCNVTKDIH